MSELQKVDTLDRQPFKNMVATIGNLPTNFVDSMSYYECLAWLCQYITGTIIPAVNNNAEAVAELQAKYIELKAYVDDYFENLDVQEEINNKLDDMAEHGELADIIAQYLQLAGMLTFDSVSDMKMAENLAVGSTCQTLGYTSKGDGGGSIYKIRRVTNDDDVDEKVLIEITADPSNELVAEFVAGDTITPQQFGAKGDGVTDDADIISYTINYATTKGLQIKLVGKYYINKKIEVNNGKSVVIYGSKSQPNTLVDEVTQKNTNFLFSANGYFELLGTSNITFDNIGFTGAGTTGIAIVIKSFRNVITNCGFNGFATAIQLMTGGGNWTGENKITQCMFQKCTICVEPSGGTDSDFTGCLIHSTCGYSLKGATAGWKIEDNHDYSANGFEISGVQTTFVGNYIDGWNKLKITGNTGFNIVGNSFIGGTPNGDSNYCIKFTSANITSGNVTGNIVLPSFGTGDPYANLCFIDLSDNNYFTAVTVNSNNASLCGKLIKGDATKIFTTWLNGVKTTDPYISYNSNVTLTEYQSDVDGVVMLSGKLTASSALTSTNVARVQYMLSSKWLFVIKEDGGTPRVEFSSSGIITASSTSVTQIEFMAIGIRPISQYKPYIL